MDALNDPKRIFNADESGFPLDGNTGKIMSVLARKGAKQVYRIGAGDKTQITLQACFNANGDFMQPFILFPGERLRNNLKNFQKPFTPRRQMAGCVNQFLCNFLSHSTTM